MTRLRSVLPVLVAVVASWAVLAMPVAAQDAITSQGIGVDRASWEGIHGAPGLDSFGFIDYESGAYNVQFMDDRVRRLERKWGEARAVTLDVARTEGVRLIPSDAQLVETYISKDRTIDLYLSPVLIGLLPSDTWINGEPGNLIVIYRALPNGRVFTIVVATGNNP